MSDVAGEPTIDLPEYRQFRLRTFFTVVTGVAVFFSLASWRPLGGTMLGILAVGAWWTWAAYRGHKGNVAYMLAPVTFGGAIGSLLLIPSWAVGPAAVDVQTVFTAIGALCGPPLLAAVLLRRLVRNIGGQMPQPVGLAYFWTTMVIYPFWFFLQEVLGSIVSQSAGTSLGPLVVDLIGLLVGVSILATVILLFTFPVSAPLAMVVGEVLWRLDARSLRWTETDLAVLETVGQIRAEGEVAVHTIHIAERLGRDYAAIRPRVERLHNAGRLKRARDGGYERTD